MNVDGADVIANVDEGFDDYFDDEEGRNFNVGIVRVPTVLLHTIDSMMHGPKDTSDKMCEVSPRTWMCAIALKFPDTRLAILRSTDPSLLPPWLVRHGSIRLIQVPTYKVACTHAFILCTR